MPAYPSWFGIVFLLGMVIAEFLFVALPAILWALIGRQKWADAFAWRRASVREWIGAALLGLGFIPWVQTLVVIQNHLWPRSMVGQVANDALILPLLQRYPVLMTFALPLAAAFSEELFFRGPLQRALLKRMPVWVAVGLASVLFATAHFDLQGFFVRTLLGILLATLVLRGRSIFPAMMTHCIYDAAALGSAAWDVHAHGLTHALRLAGQTDMGVSRAELAISSMVGTMLLAAGWGLCVSGQRRRQSAEAIEEMLGGPKTVWPPPAETAEEVAEA